MLRCAESRDATCRLHDMEFVVIRVQIFPTIGRLVKRGGNGVLRVSLNDLPGVTIGIGDGHVAAFDVLLGIMLGITRVGGTESDLDSGDYATGEDSASGLVAEEETGEEG